MNARDDDNDDEDDDVCLPLYISTSASAWKVKCQYAFRFQNYLDVTEGNHFIKHQTFLWLMFNKMIVLNIDRYYLRYEDM